MDNPIDEPISYMDEEWRGDDEFRRRLSKSVAHATGFDDLCEEFPYEVATFLEEVYLAGDLMTNPFLCLRDKKAQYLLITTILRKDCYQINIPPPSALPPGLYPDWEAKHRVDLKPAKEKSPK